MAWHCLKKKHRKNFTVTLLRNSVNKHTQNNFLMCDLDFYLGQVL